MGEANGEFILGVDIGGTKTAAVLGDASGRVYERRQFPTAPERGFERTFDDICLGMETLRSQAIDAERHPRLISVAIGGPLDIEAGIIKSPPNLPGWDNIPLKKMFQMRFALPVYIEHDGNAGALAEWYFGAARGARNVIFLTMGTGFGGGLILNSRLYRGTCDLAGEVGHVRLADDGPVAYGKAGSWEALCAGPGIARLASQRFSERWPEGQIDVKELAEHAHSGDADAQAVFHEVGRYLGRGLAMLIDILNPQVIVIGSLAVRLGDLVLAPAREVIRAEALPLAADACCLVPAALGEQLGDVACLCAAIQALGGPEPPAAGAK